VVQEGERWDRLEGQSYEEWKEGKRKQNPQNVTPSRLQEELDNVIAIKNSTIKKMETLLSPYIGDYPDYDEYLKAVREYEGKLTDYIEHIRPNTEIRFANGKYVYDGEEYCSEAKVNNAIARCQELVPLLEENDTLIVCDYANAWQFLPKGKDDRRYENEETPIAQVFMNDGQIVIAVDRSYMLGTVEESINQRQKLLAEGKILPNVFPVETPETVIVHEWGHAIHDYYTHALVYGDEDAKGLFEWWKSLSEDDIKSGISDYAAENFGEFCAECFAEMQAPNPREIAVKYWEYMKQLIEKRYRYD
jgi:hypothetical protein